MEWHEHNELKNTKLNELGRSIAPRCRGTEMYSAHGTP